MITARRDNGAVPLPAAVSAVRMAVRGLLESDEAVPYVGAPVLVACSGGADSLALAAAAAHVVRGRTVRGLVVDHGLQDGSAAVAQRAAEQLEGLGLAEVTVLSARVGGPGGMEAAARRARYAALESARPEGGLVLLGHTRDDQAETVLLGLGRGSGPRSIAGMRPLSPPWARPFLDLPRETTLTACAELGLEPWHDPHNTDERFTRVRLRTEVLPLLDDVLQGGVAPALAKTAAQLRDDSEALDGLADRVLTAAHTAENGLEVREFECEPAAVRRRVLRRWLLREGVPEVSDGHLRAADALVADWRGQGPHHLPGNFVLRRTHGTLLVEVQG